MSEAGGPTQPASGGAAAGLAPNELVERRLEVSSWWTSDSGREEDGLPQPADVNGLALSGGGIRSATYALGILQALAKAETNPFARIDIVSTVSGGSYIGCFLRSLFMPASHRGVLPQAMQDLFANRPAGQARRVDPGDRDDQLEFAMRALRSGPHEQDIRGPGNGPEVRNPIWWLREHSRYLAPNGPTDYGFMVAYWTRNWAAMLYIFLLALAGIMTAIIGAEALIRWNRPDAFDGTWPVVDGRAVPVSPIFLLVLAPAALSAATAIGYWMTQAMSANEPRVGKQWGNFSLAVLQAIAAGIALVLLWRLIEDWQGPADGVARAITRGGMALTGVGIVIAIGVAAATAGRKQLLTAELRRRLTRLLALFNWLALLLIALALIDSFGAALRQYFWAQGGLTGRTGSAATLLLFAWAIRKLQDSFGGSRGRVEGLLERYLSPLALAAGVLLYGALAVVAAALVHAAVWTGPAWDSPPDVPTALLVAAIVAVLGVLGGMATGFINLSSQNGLYASRLTRAYLGASNVERLRKAADRKAAGSRITETDPNDFIQPELYSTCELAAPVHIINATLNTTVDLDSQIVARDRKGDLLTLEPHGIRAGTREEATPWERIGDRRWAEQLSLGQWCAISGASASTGMGRMTNLGFALALAFANVRTGYWWWSPGISSESGKVSFALRWSGELFGTFIYLWNEMTVRYSRAYDRKYLSDGGHYENSGAYALIRREVPRIIVSDAAMDIKYEFKDLERLVRTARLDLGAEIAVLAGGERQAFLDAIGCKQPWLFADPDATSDWRGEFADPQSRALAAALGVRTKSGRTLHMVWIKPRRISALPADLAGYASKHVDFPQQSTGDQYFDEAQWESYRKLGEATAERLLAACPGLLPG